ncbi:zinc ribbon domain-containing protein [Thermopirellula anaerolimosa]
MKITCPNCETEVPVEDVDLSTGWARCRECNELFQVPEIAHRGDGKSPLAASMPISDGPIERPADARILIERRPDKLFIYVPAMGFRWALVPVMGFAIFWLGFIAFWTIGALGLLGGMKDNTIGIENILFACFSIPFWLVGFAMLGGCLWAMTASRLVYLDAATLMTRIKALFFSWRWSLSRDQVQTVRLRTGPTSREEDSADINTALTPHVVEIVYKNGKLPIYCAAADEQRWVYGEIRAFLDSVPYRPGAESPMWQEETDQFRPLSRDVDFDRDRFTT